MSELIITPKTNVLELIEAYPQLEEVLIEYLPVFKKLRNPILRKTVARITTLHQAAIVGNENVEDLINHLRKEVGQDLFSGESAAASTMERPDWFAEDRVVSPVWAWRTGSRRPATTSMPSISRVPGRANLPGS
jgi:hypothetical protein